MTDNKSHWRKLEFVLYPATMYITRSRYHTICDAISLPDSCLLKSLLNCLEQVIDHSNQDSATLDLSFKEAT